MHKNKKYGHWFCDNCDDVVFMSFENTESKNVPCPVCGHLSCNFIPDKLGKSNIHAHWFEKMREAVDKATTPTLPI